MKTGFAFLIFLALTLMGAPSAVMASDDQVVHIGGNDCAYYNRVRVNPDDRFHLVNWSQGWLSGINVGYHHKDMTQMRRIPTLPMVEAELDRRCAEKPDELIFFVLVELYGDLKRM
tara:strand:- start:6691 stop:7038 length:348 start_codon:yes stop_codon:yes gene_type:complete